MPAQKANKKITITGKVVDINNIPVQGAIIMIDGKNTETKTNKEGNYKMKVKLPVSTIGVFTTLTGAVEEPVTGRTRINFNLDKSIIPAIDAGQSEPVEDRQTILRHTSTSSV